MCLGLRSNLILTEPIKFKQFKRWTRRRINNLNPRKVWMKRISLDLFQLMLKSKYCLQTLKPHGKIVKRILKKTLIQESEAWWQNIGVKLQRSANYNIKANKVVQSHHPTHREIYWRPVNATKLSLGSIVAKTCHQIIRVFKKTVICKAYKKTCNTLSIELSKFYHLNQKVRAVH